MSREKLSAKLFINFADGYAVTEHFFGPKGMKQAVKAFSHFSKKGAKSYPGSYASLKVIGMTGIAKHRQPK